MSDHTFNVDLKRKSHEEMAGLLVERTVQLYVAKVMLLRAAQALKVHELTPDPDGLVADILAFLEEAGDG